MRIFSSVGNLIDRLSVMVGAIVGSQVPTFIQQYMSRLEGHVEELQKILNQLRGAASISNKTLEEYIHKFIINPDQDFVHHGEFLQSLVIRYEQLNQTLYHLTQSSVWTRPYMFLHDLQHDIAHSTLISFQPGIQFNLEGLTYILIGSIAGWAFYQILAKIFTIGFSRVVVNSKQTF